jgi:hypothetical protein
MMEEEKHADTASGGDVGRVGGRAKLLLRPYPKTS